MDEYERNLIAGTGNPSKGLSAATQNRDERDRRLCQLVSDFDDGWRAGTPSLERAWAEGRSLCGSDGEADEFLRDLLAIERSRREAREEQPTLAEYLQRLPECQTAVEAAFPPTLKQFGNYELLALLGRGGMGEVYEARNTLTERIGAVKLIRMHLLEDPQAAARFEREIKHLSRLEGNPHVVSIRTAGRHDGTLFLEMELIDGANLEVLRQSQNLTVADCCEIARQAAVGLAGAHAEGIVHRDIKPLNLMLSRSERVQILDFGLARLRESTREPVQSYSTSGMALGTPLFMAPEQLEGDGTIDARTDVYSLGVTLYLLLSGHGPYAGRNVLELVSALATRQPTPLSQFRSDLPADLLQLVMSMIAKDRDQRVPTASDAATLLAPFVSGNRLRKLSASLPRRNAGPSSRDPDAAVEDTLKLNVSAATPRISPHEPATPIPRGKSRRWSVDIAVIAVVGLVALLITTPIALVALNRNAKKVPEGFHLPQPLAPLASSHPAISARLGEISALAFRPGGKSLIFGTFNGELQEVFPDTGKAVPWPDAHGGGVNEISVRDDGKMIASASADGTIRLADETGKCVHRIRQTEPVQAAQWRPGKKTLLTHGTESGMAHLWDENGIRLNEIKTGKNYASAAGWMDGGDLFFTGNGDKTIRFWLPDGSPAGSLPPSPTSGFGCVSRAGDVFTYGGAHINISPKGSHVWITESFPVQNTFKPVFSPSGKLAILGKKNERSVLLKLRSAPVEGTMFDQVAELDSGPAFAAVWRDETHFALGGKRLTFWKLAGGDPLRVELETDLKMYAGPKVCSLAWQPGGKTLAVGAEPGILGLYDAKGKLQKQLSATGPTPFCLAFSPSGDWLAEGNEAGMIRFWKPSGEKGKEFDSSQNRSVTQLAWNHSESWVAATWHDAPDVQFFGPVATTGGRGPGIGADQLALRIGFSPLDEWLAVGLHKTAGIQLWMKADNYRTYRKLVFNPGTSLRDDIAAMQVHPTLPLIAAGSAYGRAGIIEVKEKKTHTFLPFMDPKSPKKWLHAPWSIREIAWHPQGEWLACVDGSGKISLWSRHGKYLGVLDADRDGMIRIRWSPSGRYLAAGGMRGAILVWDFSENGDAGIRVDQNLGPIQALEWSSNDLLAVGSQGGYLTILDPNAIRIVSQSLIAIPEK